MVETAQFVPTVYLYDNFPGGVGLSEPLWQRQGELVQRARELVAACDCSPGCPACVGPVLAIDEDKTLPTPTQLALQVLALLAESAAWQQTEAAGAAQQPIISDPRRA